MTTMTDKELYQAAHTMLASGGSFATYIASAFFVADKDNKAKLLAAFGELFERYAPTKETSE